MITNFVPDLLCFGQQHYICSQKVRIVTTKKLACNNIQNHALQANGIFAYFGLGILFLSEKYFDGNARKIVVFP